jgi:hypothetical protein
LFFTNGKHRRKIRSSNIMLVIKMMTKWGKIPSVHHSKGQIVCIGSKVEHAGGGHWVTSSSSSSSSSRCASGWLNEMGRRGDSGISPASRLSRTRKSSSQRSSYLKRIRSNKIVSSNWKREYEFRQ